MKLATILILAFVLMGLAGSLAGTYYYYGQSNVILEDQVIHHLESFAQSTENFINEVLKEQRDKLEIVATHGRHGELSVDELKVIVGLQEEFYELFILDSTGNVVVSSDESQTGKDKSGDAYFINARTETYIKPAYISETSGRESIAVATPFHEGVLVARMELESFNEIFSDRTGLGETGESLMAYKGGDGYPAFFTERRFGGSVGEEIGVLPMDVALSGEEKVILDSFDYRGIEVIAVTRYIEEANFGIVTKIDEAEALGIARSRLIRTSVWIIIVVFLFFSIVGFLISRWVSCPIKKLTLNVDEVTKGKLDIQLPRSGVFEVQSLTDSLNRILTSLKLAILRTGASKGELGLGEVAKAKEEVEGRYRALYESSRDAIMMLAPPTWNFTAGNPATIKMFGAKDEVEFVSKNPGELSPEKQPDGKLSADSAKAHIMKAMKEGSDFFNWTHRRISGEDFPATVLLTKVVIDGKEVLQATVRDMTGKSETCVPKVLAAARGIPSKGGTSDVPSSSGKKVVVPVNKPVVKSIEKVIWPKKTSVERKSLRAIDEINRRRKDEVLGGGV